jgi:phosphohistidine phosphatase
VKLYFFRHGPALSRAEWDGPDEQRPLSDDGAQITRTVSQRIAGMGLSIDTILASPYVRAWDTGTILAEVLGRPGLLVSERALEPVRFTRATLEDALAAYAGSAGVVLIGHEPSMSAVISDLIGGGTLTLKKAGLARVDLHPGTPLTGELRWLFPPRML